ncbi:MAG: hypothetical protein EOM65_15305 [Synergistales bacterium]|nr:hypothetical protein [Synergistales bacterium]
MRKQPVHPASSPVPAGAYTPGLIAGGFVFVSGQTAEKPGSSELVEGDVKVQTRQVLENIRGILEAAGCSLDDVVKVTAHLADVRDFDGYNGVYRQFFTAPFPVRTTVQSVIPGGSLVEIDVIALLPERPDR